MTKAGLKLRATDSGVVAGRRVVAGPGAKRPTDARSSPGPAPHILLG